MVKEIFGNKETLLFDFVSIETVLKEYTLSNDIRTKIVKQMLIHFSNLYLMVIINLPIFTIFCLVEKSRVKN